METNKPPKKLIFSIAILSLLAFIALGAGTWLIVTNSNSPKNQTGSSPQSPANSPESDLESEKSDTQYISHPNYPFDLPQDGPFNFEEMETLYTQAQQRYSIFFNSSQSNSEKFQEEITPYVKLYMASSEYVFQNYSEVFEGERPENDDRKDLSLKVYEKCTDISSGLDEDMCKDAKMVGSASPFTLSNSFYINKEHPDFHTDFIIIIGMHETIHILQYTYESNVPGSLIPKWYKESMAEGLAYGSDHKKQLYPELFVDYEYPNSFEEFSKLYSEEGDTIESLNNLRRGYTIGAEFFDYLMQQTTLEEYLTLISKDSSPMNNEFDNHFKQIFGKSKEEMYTDFLREN
jgi:hypothetical protein